MLERDFESQVADLAGLGGWLRYHTYNSRRSPAGFPDDVLVHPQRKLIVFAELKKQDGVVTPEQKKWLRAIDEIAQVSPHVHVDVWRPSMSSEIERLLLGKTRTAPTR